MCQIKYSIEQRLATLIVASLYVIDNRLLLQEVRRRFEICDIAASCSVSRAHFSHDAAFLDIANVDDLLVSDVV